MGEIHAKIVFVITLSNFHQLW